MMFENSSVMVITDEYEPRILKIDTNAKTQISICNAFAESVSTLFQNKHQIVFNGSYKPDNDECLTIKNFQIPNEIQSAICNPLGVTSYGISDKKFPDIKCFFVGEYVQTNNSIKLSVAFQRFRKEQYISKKNWYNLFFDNNSFYQENKFGFSISNNIDCFYESNDLHFLSFYFARQVFDLSQYYRIATDQDVNDFIANEKLLIENPVIFMEMSDTFIRRKIAMINDSEILKKFSALKIKNIAKKLNINISVKNQKIIIPNNKNEVKLILKLLDEEAYQGVFSQTLFLTNSKRQVVI